MNKPVLVIVMSMKCGACLNFKAKILPDLEKELSVDPRIKFVKLDFSDMAIPTQHPELKYHPELRGMVRFFPTIILFPGNLWHNNSSKLKGVVKHGDEERPNIDYSKASIKNWIKNTLENDPLFKSPEKQNMGSLAKPLEDGRYMVPTYGTYSRFKKTKMDESEISR